MLTEIEEISGMLKAISERLRGLKVKEPRFSFIESGPVTDRPIDVHVSLLVYSHVTNDDAQGNVTCVSGGKTPRTGYIFRSRSLKTELRHIQEGFRKAECIVRNGDSGRKGSTVPRP